MLTETAARQQISERVRRASDPLVRARAEAPRRRHQLAAGLRRLADALDH